MAELIPAGPVVLRRWGIDHLDQLLAAMDQSIDDLRMWMDWATDGVPSRQAQRAAIQTAADDFDRDFGWQYSMFEPDGQALVGACGLQRTARDDCVSINYWVRSDRSGRGYATAATRGLTTAAFAALPWLNAVEIQMDCSNIASAKIPEKLGYRFIRTESHEIKTSGQSGHRFSWAIVRRDWPSFRKPYQR